MIRSSTSVNSIVMRRILTMFEFSYENIEKSINVLELDLTVDELAMVAEANSMTSEQMSAFDILLEHLRKKKIQTTIDTLLRFSRLPSKNPKTFDNFDFSVVKSRDIDKLKSLPSLTAIHAHKNLAFIGPAGIGKTHLAQAFGYECCQQGLKAYFIKMSELRDRFTAARRNNRESSVINGLVRPSCLIIDEVGRCTFDKENTRLFFDLIDRRYNKEGSFNTIFTSNKNPLQWKEFFEEDDTTLCALDRIFDDATIFRMRGESYRGRKLDKVVIQVGKQALQDTPAEIVTD